MQHDGAQCQMALRAMLTHPHLSGLFRNGQWFPEPRGLLSFIHSLRKAWLSSSSVLSPAHKSVVCDYLGVAPP